MDNIHTTWKNKRIEQGFKNVNSNVKIMTDFFVTIVKNLEPEEDKHISYAPRKVKANI